MKFDVVFPSILVALEKSETDRDQLRALATALTSFRPFPNSADRLSEFKKAAAILEELFEQGSPASGESDSEDWKLDYEHSVGLAVSDQGDDAARSFLDDSMFQEPPPSDRKNVILAWIRENQWIFAPPIYVIGLAFLWSLLLACRPLWLLELNEHLKPYQTQLPKWLGGFEVSVPIITLVAFFCHRKRVLNAWVERHVDRVQRNFESQDTVSDQAVHVPIPVICEGRTIPELTAQALRRHFSGHRACLLIHGEGGSGKTSLACQVGKWAMAVEPHERLRDHRMLPILIEQELDLEVGEGEALLVKVVHGQLQASSEIVESIPQELVLRLLKAGRILVIVDHFSEMSESTRQQIRPGDPKCPVRALVVPSRSEETLDRVPKLTVESMRVQGDRLSSFMEAYLMQRRRRQLFNDVEFFQACGRLSSMVGQRDITILLAKLYAEQMIAAKQAPSDQEMPDDVPELMVQYLNELNRSVDELSRRADLDVHRDVMAVAWQCVQDALRPRLAELDRVHEDLGEHATERLEYLERRLRVIHTIQPWKDKIRFALDPFAEYMAGLHLVQTYGAQMDRWRGFFERIESIDGAPETIRGFLLALRDCCRSKGAHPDVPDFVSEEIMHRLTTIGKASFAPTAEQTGMTESAHPGTTDSSPANAESPESVEKRADSLAPTHRR